MHPLYEQHRIKKGNGCRRYEVVGIPAPVIDVMKSNKPKDMIVIPYMLTLVNGY